MCPLDISCCTRASATSRRARRHDPYLPRPLEIDFFVLAKAVFPNEPLEYHCATHLKMNGQAIRQSTLSTSPWPGRARQTPPRGIAGWDLEEECAVRCGTPPSPPSWKYDVTDLRAFSKWARKIEIGRAQIRSYMTSREAALLLCTSLTGEAEAELEHRPWSASTRTTASTTSSRRGRPRWSRSPCTRKGNSWPTLSS